MNNKPKRPRKPSQPLKVVHRQKTPDSGRKLLTDEDTGLKSKDSMYDGREFSKFYADEVRSRR